MGEDGRVDVVFNMDANDAEKELERLKKRVLRLESTLSEGSSKKNALADKLKEAKQELADLQNKATIKNGKFTFSESDIARQGELRDIIVETEAAIKKQNATIEDTKMKIDGVKQRYAEVSQIAADGEAPGAMERVREAFASIGGHIKNIAARVPDIVRAIGSKALNGAKGLATMLGRAAKSMMALGHASKSANGSLASSLKTMLRYGFGIRSLFVLFNKIRSGIVDGFKNLVQYSSQTNASVSMLKSALTQLKNSLATAFAPILTAIAPILATFINMLSRAADAIARLTAMLTGQSSYIRATKVQEDYAASLDKTGKSAKNAGKSLASFDKINKLSDNKSGSGGGGGNVDPSQMFEKVAIEPAKFDSWGQAFSAMLDSILNNGIPKLEQGLTNMATWLNGFSSNLYEMFTFPGVHDKVVQLGESISNAFNDMVNKIDWKTLGGALGAGLNLALGFLVSLVYTFDWLNLGANLAAAFNAMVAEIDWYAMGQWLFAKFKIALETLAGFLLNLDMVQLAQAASQIVIGFFESMSNTIQNINWYALGEQVKTFLVNVDWPGVATAVFNAIGSAFGGATAFLWGLIHDAWEKVINWWHDVAYEDGKFTVEGLLNGIKNKMFGIGSWIKKNIFEPFSKGIRDAFGIHSPSTVMEENGEYLMLGMANGINGDRGAVLTAFDLLLNGMTQTFGAWRTNFLDGFAAFQREFGSGWNAFWGRMHIAFAIKWNEILSSLQSGINNAIRALNELIRSANQIAELTGKHYSSVKNISISRLDIPRLAQGAVIPANREFLAVLGDQKQGTNIETPLETMVQAFRQALAESGFNGENNAVLMLDRDVLGRVVYQLNKAEGNRIGVSLTGV